MVDQGALAHALINCRGDRYPVDTMVIESLARLDNHGVDRRFFPNNRPLRVHY